MFNFEVKWNALESVRLTVRSFFSAILCLPWACPLNERTWILSWPGLIFLPDSGNCFVCDFYKLMNFFSSFCFVRSRCCLRHCHGFKLKSILPRLCHRVYDLVGLHSICQQKCRLRQLFFQWHRFPFLNKAATSSTKWTVWRFGDSQRDCRCSKVLFSEWDIPPSSVPADGCDRWKGARTSWYH